jgi:cystathionine beta-lyase/cystathionine gamma-synthase
MGHIGPSHCINQPLMLFNNVRSRCKSIFTSRMDLHQVDNPTVDVLEQRLAALEGVDCRCSDGPWNQRLSISTTLSLLKAGDHIESTTSRLRVKTLHARNLTHV